MPPDNRSDDRTRTVEIPERTASAISKRLRQTEFESVDGYVAFALDRLLRELDRAADDGRSDRESSGGTIDDGPTDDGASDGGASDDGATNEAVADRLESLGYL